MYEASPRKKNLGMEISHEYKFHLLQFSLLLKLKQIALFICFISAAKDVMNPF